MKGGTPDRDALNEFGACWQSKPLPAAPIA